MSPKKDGKKVQKGQVVCAKVIPLWGLYVHVLLKIPLLDKDYDA